MSKYVRKGATNYALPDDLGSGSPDASKVLCGDAVYRTPVSVAFPVSDLTVLIKGSGDPSKQLRIEVDGISGSTTRVWTAPDADLTVVGLDTVQTLTNKTLTTPTIGNFSNADHAHQDNAGGGTLAEAALALTDITTNNASNSKHGFLPKLSGSSTDVLRGDGTWGTGGALPAGSGTELQYRFSGTTFGALTGSSVSGADLSLGGNITTVNSRASLFTDIGGGGFNCFEGTIFGDLADGKLAFVKSTLATPIGFFFGLGVVTEPFLKVNGAGLDMRTGDDGAYSAFAASILDARTGFRIAGGAALGKYLSGNGTNFVSTSLLAGDLVGQVSVANGGTSLATLTAHSLYVGNGASAPTALGSATNGQLPIGSTGADPVLAALTAGAGIAITNAAGAITVAVAAAPSVRAYNSAAQSILNNATTAINLDSERWDTDTSHFTSVAALTGTVSTTSGSQTVTGSVTAKFQDELSVGQVISIPNAKDGTNPCKCVVTAIASQTSLTVANQTKPGSTQSGKTATRVNSTLVARTAGKYGIWGGIAYASNATGDRYARILYNDTDELMDFGGAASTSGGFESKVITSTLWDMAQWDYVELMAYQNITGGGALNSDSNAKLSPEFMMHWFSP